MFPTSSLLYAGVFLRVVLSVSGAEKWGYEGHDGPNSWAENFADCGGNRQSPIDLNSFTLTQAPKLKWSGYDNVPDSMTLVNNGHSMALTSEGPNQPEITTSDGKVFQLANTHFHWGKTKDDGSEHTLEGVRYTLEMHAVHVRLADDGSIADPSEIIVITSFFQHSRTRGDPGLNRVIWSAPRVVEPESSTEIEPFAWSKLIPMFTEDFYWYEGSLTTPPCSEVVSFFIRRRVPKVSSKQMSFFRSLLNEEHHPISGNVRPLQKRNNRKIYYNKG